MKYAMILRVRDEFCDVVAQNLYYENQLVLICIEDLKALSAWLLEGKRPEILILDSESFKLENVYKFFEKVQPAPVIHYYCDENPSLSSPDIKVFKRDQYEIETVIRNVTDTYPKAGLKTREEVPDYVPFSIQYFANVKSFMSDIYIMLKKKDQTQFVKRINAGEEIDRETLQKYQDSGMENLYIKKEFRFQFVNQAVDEAIEELRSPKEKTLFNAADENFQLTAEMLMDMGITENTVKLTKASIMSMRQTLKKLDTVAPLLEKLLKEKLSYSYKRVHITAMFAVEVLKRIDWFSKDQQSLLIEQLVFSVFLHDILLNDEKLLKIHSKLDLYESGLDEKEKSLVLNHANLTSNLVQKYPKSPPYVDVIIKQHHGTTNGVGFSENHSASILKQAIILIVVEKFVMRILDYKKDSDKLSDIILDLEREFTLPSYAKVLESLKETLFEAVKSS